DFRRSAVLGAWYPGVVARAGASVRGALVHVASAEEWERLDRYEGDEEYERRPVRVTVAEAAPAQADAPTPPLPAWSPGVVVDADVYVWVAGEHRLDAQDWSYERFVRHGSGGGASDGGGIDAAVEEAVAVSAAASGGWAARLAGAEA
ncbi:hypothetical protein HK405_014282, partial [Cladochytrium tenue]